MRPFVFQAPALRGARGFGGHPRLRRLQHRAHQRRQALAGIFAVLLLAAEALGLDDDFAGFGNALVALFRQALLDRGVVLEDSREGTTWRRN